MTDLADSPAPLAASGDRLEALSSVLLDRGLVDDKTLDRARRVAGETGQRLDAVLTQLGLVSERGLAEALAALSGRCRWSRPTAIRTTPLLADRLKASSCARSHALPIAVEADRVIARHGRSARPVHPRRGRRRDRPASSRSRSPCRSNSTRRWTGSIRTPTTRMPEAEARGTGDEPLEEDAERLKDLASEAPVIRLVNQMIARAVETQASDIHIEPFEDRLRVRYRYDGVLHEAESPPARLTAAIISRIKIMARLDIAERRLPQDGRIQLAVRGQEIDFRVSTIPSLHGETVVLRVLDRTAVEFDLAKLGLPPAVIGGLQRRCWNCRTASCWSPARPAAARPRRSTPACCSSTRSPARSSRSRTRSNTSSTGINQIQVKPQIGLTSPACCARSCARIRT